MPKLYKKFWDRLKTMVLDSSTSGGGSNINISPENISPLTTQVAVFRPTDLFSSKSVKCALILLNGEPNCRCIDAHIEKIWPLATAKICADGAALRLLKFNQQNQVDYVPSIICGDLDSCSQEILELHKRKGTEIFHLVDDNTTDFTKGVELLNNRGYFESGKINCLVVIGGLCGRFDQSLGCMNTLFLARTRLKVELPFYLLHNENLVALLPAGRSIIHLDRKFLTGKCGLVPLGCIAHNVTTQGLEWNLKNQECAFGALVSTSNILKNDIVEVSSDSLLLWTMELNMDVLM